MKNTDKILDIDKYPSIYEKTKINLDDFYIRY